MSSIKNGESSNVGPGNQLEEKIVIVENQTPRANSGYAVNEQGSYSGTVKSSYASICAAAEEGLCPAAEKRPCDVVVTSPVRSRDSQGFTVVNKWSFDGSPCRPSTSRKLYKGDHDTDEESQCSCGDPYYPDGLEKPCSIADSATLLRKSRWQTFKNYFRRHLRRRRNIRSFYIRSNEREINKLDKKKK